MPLRRSGRPAVLSLAALAAAGAALWLVTREGIDAPDTARSGVARATRPLLLVTVDTTRADRLAPYGAKLVETPAFSRLADEGVLFERAYAVAPITLVSHASILTGLYPPQHGVRNNGIHRLDEEASTLAERLRERGFRTAAFVSAAVLERRYGLDQGFELYDDDLSTGRERRPRMVADRPAGATAASALGWLDTLERDEPFFLWVHFYDPHAAYSPPPPWRDRYRDRLYDGEIAYMDSELARLLEHERLADDAIVLAIGDHGESLGEHGEHTHGILAYDATLRVPWLLRVPGGPRGVRIAEPVSQVDVLPTVLDLLGVSAPEEADLAGRSVVPLFTGSGEGPRARPLYAETFLPFYTYGWAKLRVLRQGGWKLIDAPRSELYDLARDPRELSNRYEEEPGAAHDLERDLGELAAVAGTRDHEVALTLDAEDAERLRSLGYLAIGSEPPAAEDSSRPDPKDVIDLHVGLERARRLLGDRLFAHASATLREVLDRDPRNLAALLDLATALEGEGKAEESFEVLERAIALDPGYPRIRLQLARLETRRGDPDKALGLVDSVLALHPGLIEAMIQQASLLSRLGRHDEAAQRLAAALGENPEHAPLNVAFARLVEMREGKLDEAAARLRLALRRDPFLASGWQLLGAVQERQGRFDEAAASYREGLRRAPDDADLHAGVGLVLARRGGGAEAEQHLREAIRLSDEFRAELHVALGAWLAEHGRVTEAGREYDLVLEREPGNPGALNNWAIASYHQGRREEAREALERLVAGHPRHADALNNLAAIELDRDRWPAAESWARRAIEADPGLVEAWNNLGIALDEQNRLAEAEAGFRRAIEIDPAYWQARNNLAVTTRKRGEPGRAAELLEEVLREVPAEPEVHHELGMLYAGPLADPIRARKHLNAFLRLNPRDDRAAAVRARIAALDRPAPVAPVPPRDAPR